MTARQIKSALRRNARTGARPRSLYEAAKMRGCHRSVMTRALQEPSRYADARAWLESVLLVARERASA